MKRFTLQILTGICAISLLSTAAIAKLKVDQERLAAVETVAVVGYSFLRDVQFEEASITKLKQEEIPLLESDEEYIMMQEADQRLIEALQALGSFTVIPSEDVVTNELYIDETKDPEKKLNMSWYFPKGYREIKLKKKNAVALAEELGVDAVLVIHFDSRSSTQGTSWGGIYNKEEYVTRMEGEFTMFGSDGKEILSGEARSAKLEKGSSRSWGVGGGVEITPVEDTTAGDGYYHALLESYMQDLHKQLNGE